MYVLEVLASRCSQRALLACMLHDTMEVYVDRTVYPWVEPTAACFGCTVLNGVKRGEVSYLLKFWWGRVGI
jgi:hypothetical protein